MELRHKPRSASKLVPGLLTHGALILASVVIGLPFLWMITTAIKSPSEVYIFPPVPWPETIRFDNFVTAWRSAPFGRFYINSIVTATTGVILEVAIAALSAYAFSRIRFKYRDVLFMVLLAAMMIPGQVALIPNYVVLKHLAGSTSTRVLSYPMCPVYSALSCCVSISLPYQIRSMTRRK